MHILETVSMQSLINILLGRYSSLTKCRAGLHQKAQNLNRRKVYTAIANITLYYLRPVFLPETPASTDQQAANLSAAAQSHARAQFYKPVIDELSKVGNLEVVKIFLGYLGQPPGTIADTSSTEILSLVQLVHRRAPTPVQLRQNLASIVKHQSSPEKAKVLARHIFRAFQLVYLITPVPVTTPIDRLATLEQELTQKCDVDQVRVLLYSILHGPYADSPLQRQMLKTKTLRDLLDETFEYCPTYSDFESKLTILAHCLKTTDDLNRALKVMLVALYRYYQG